jgi:dTDP-4-dehydrorhamnose reductase
VLAGELNRVGGALVHLSTDYVFDGAKATAYTETDACNPLSVYGRSKLAGEQAVIASGVPALVLRTSWVYAMRGRNFPRTILRLAAEREELRIVEDQWGAPTWARSIADGIAAIIARAGSDRQSVAASIAARGGVYHMTNAGRTNWHLFASAVLALHPDRSLKVKSIAPIPTWQYPTPARRPPNSSLDCARLALAWSVALPHWQAALALAVADQCAADASRP